MAADVATQLATVQAAIAKIEGGAQSYVVDGVTVTRASLATLYQREKDLLFRLQRSTRRVFSTIRFQEPRL